jgi:hypothetical protein
MAQGDFFSDWLESDPRFAYYSSAPFGGEITSGSPFGGGYSPAAQNYWSGQYGNVVSQYEGEMGRSIRAGEMPSLTFTDFLTNYPWTERYTSLGPGMRPGGRSSRFSPSTRFVY